MDGPEPAATRPKQAAKSRKPRASLPSAEPAAPVSVPCPDWLDADAKKVWAQITPILEEMGVMTSADSNALARYCQLFARWKRAEQFIQQYGETYPVKSGNGTVKCFFQWPQVTIAQKLAITLTKLEHEFGLTPAARSRIEVQSNAEMSEEQEKLVQQLLWPYGDPAVNPGSPPSA